MQAPLSPCTEMPARRFFFFDCSSHSNESNLPSVPSFSILAAAPRELATRFDRPPSDPGRTGYNCNKGEVDLRNPLPRLASLFVRLGRSAPSLVSASVSVRSRLCFAALDIDVEPGGLRASKREF